MIKARYEYPVIIEEDEDGVLIASGCHTQAKNLSTLLKRIKEAISLYLEVEDIPPLKFIGVQSVSVSKPR